jgi:hypothetical protein
MFLPVKMLFWAGKVLRCKPGKFQREEPGDCAGLSLTVRVSPCADGLLHRKKGQQFGVELLLVRFGQAVGSA